MSEHSQAGPDLDRRLAELDRRLREIQADLVGEDAPDFAAHSVEPRPQAPEPPGPVEPVEPFELPESPELPEPPEPAEPPDPVEPPEASEQPVPSRPAEPPAPAAPIARDIPLRAPIGHGRSGPLADLLAHLQARPEHFQSELADLKVLLAELHGTLDGIEAVLERLAGRGGRGQARSPEPSRQPEIATIAAGPFTTLDSVRAFERELSRLPGVREAAVRGYEGAARAIIDVQFGEDH